MLDDDRFLKKIFKIIGFVWLCFAVVLAPFLMVMNGDDELYLVKYSMFVFFPFYLYFSLKFFLTKYGSTLPYEDRPNDESIIKSYFLTFFKLCRNESLFNSALFFSGVIYFLGCYYLLSWMGD